MDIYEYAKSIDYMADYYDYHTGRTYLLTKANEFGGKIPVMEDGEIIGFAQKKDEQ